jgi:hypothetical protein
LRICMEAVGFINIAPVDNHEAMVAPSSALGWQLALEGYKNEAQLRAEGRVRRPRSRDIDNTLRSCSRVSTRRVRTAHRAVLHRVTYQRIGANGVYGARRWIRHDSPWRV